MTGFFIDTSEDRVTDLGAQNGTRLVPANTILLIVRGMSLKNEFRMGITTRPVTFNQDLKALIAVDGIVPAFLAYAIKARTDEILGLVGEAGHGTGVLPTDRIQSLRIPVPTLPEQRAIAHILGTLDDKIELNRRTNETLEAMARALFKSWFVDFDPVHAKAAGRKPGGMDAETAALFPSEFDDSELGPVPKGWALKPLGDLMELKRGYDLPQAKRREGTVPIVSSSGRSGLHREAMAKAPGIVTGRYGTIGKVYLVREDFWPLNTTLYVRDLKGSDVYFAYHLLSNIDFRKFSDKAAVPGINRNDLHDEPVIAPPRTLQARFARIAGLQMGMLDASHSQSSTLIGIRDTLLPRLLSGEIAAPIVERIIEAAT